MSRVLRSMARDLGSLWLWPRRKRVGVGDGDVALAYAGEQVPMMLALAVVLGIETAVVGLLVPWPWVHVLDVCAVLQVLGMAGTMVTRPHFVGGGRLVLRNGALFALTVPLDTVRTVRAERKLYDNRTFQLDGAELSIVVGCQTDVRVELTEPMTVIRPNGVRVDAKVLRFRAEDPKAAVSSIRAAVVELGTPPDRGAGAILAAGPDQ